MKEEIIKYSDKLNKINYFINNKKYKNYKIMYHLTTKKNALSILKNNFNIKLSKARAFGKGINLTNNINHLKHYYSKNKYNCIIVCLVKYNKLKYNPPYTWKKSDSNKENDYYKKHHHSKPTYYNTPKGYEGMYWNNIFVLSNKKYIFPLLIEKIKF